SFRFRSRSPHVLPRSGGCSFSSSQHLISIQVLHLKLESKQYDHQDFESAYASFKEAYVEYNDLLSTLKALGH
ncbi:hypothetical protein, partial [Burkholderia ubonensis]|uniref:hypothetical protein n=1 Tax=Burkholderia ubonensis TaxID=101571 RepID=UPI001E559409